MYYFGRVYFKEHFCEIILNLDACFRRNYSLKIFHIFSSGGNLKQQSETVCAMLV